MHYTHSPLQEIEEVTGYERDQREKVKHHACLAAMLVADFSMSKALLSEP